MVATLLIEKGACSLNAYFHILIVAQAGIDSREIYFVLEGFVLVNTSQHLLLDCIGRLHLLYEQRSCTTAFESKMAENRLRDKFLLTFLTSFCTLLEHAGIEVLHKRCQRFKF